MTIKTLLPILALLTLLPISAQAAYKKAYMGEMETYKASQEDTLVHIARKHELGFVELRAANPHIDPWLPGRGTKITLPTRHILPDATHKGVVINIAEMRLYAFVNGDEAPDTFPIAIGREGLETPTGTTTIIRKKDGPTWRPTARMREADPTLPASVPAGPENPLGTHAVYLGWPTYAIHGTNKPFGIGRRVSSGCIRMYPENILEFFKLAKVGMPVRVVNQPIKLAWIKGELFLEAHPDLEQSIQMEETGIVSTHKMTDADMAQIIKAAGKHQDRLHWSKIRMAVRERAGYPILIAIDPDYKADQKTVKNTATETEKPRKRRRGRRMPEYN